MTRVDGPRRANRLAQETSPYLLQHARNPVDWYPWGDEALARARAEGKPIFLSIGYAACHWCHVMERESFEDDATAAQLNRDFVAIKVDREERPDLDQVYMAAVQAMTGSGGWPMSVFLTPDGKPFYGGTYFPNEPRGGLPSFRQVLDGVSRAWAEQRAEVEQAGSRLVAALGEQSRLRAGEAGVEQPLLDTAVAALESQFDARDGGWGRAPKFPQPMTIEFLLRRALGGDTRAMAMARRTLDAMADGGVRDQLGGGFHRYATDSGWLIPHFEQMLYDNAQLARVYLHAWQLTAERRYRDVAIGALDYMERELATPEGAFASSQDADTQGVEGGTFTWTADEVRGALGGDALGGDALGGDALGGDAPLFMVAYGVVDGGNWEGVTILSRSLPDAELAGRFDLPAAEVAVRLARARETLFERRQARPQPARDDKVLASWNGLAIAAFADAARALACDADPGSAERAAAYRAIAVRAADAVERLLLGESYRLRRSWCAGRTSGTGVLEDYAHLADGLLALYELTYDERRFATAVGLMETVEAHFPDPEGGWFDTADDHESLVARPKDVQDNALPSGNATAATVLLRLAAWTGAGDDRAAGERALRIVAPFLARHPTGVAQWLVAADLALAPALEVAVVGDPADPETARLLAPAAGPFHPHQVTAAGRDASTSVVPLLQGRFALHGRPTAFVCRDFACRQPVNEPEALAALLAEGEERPRSLGQ